MGRSRPISYYSIQRYFPLYPFPTIFHKELTCFHEHPLLRHEHAFKQPISRAESDVISTGNYIIIELLPFQKRSQAPLKRE